MNKVVLIGRLTKDPDLRFVAGSGTAICRFTIAVNRRKKDDGADFINCTSWGKTAETISQYLTKGREIAIVGRINTGSYDDKDGKKIYTTDVAVESFEFIGSGNKRGTDSTFNNGFDNDIEPVHDGDMPF